MRTPGANSRNLAERRPIAGAMSVLSNIRSRISSSLHDAEKAAADAAEKAKQAVASAAGAAKERARTVVADPPAPSAASVSHASQASVDAARNAPAAAKQAPVHKEAGIYAGFGASAAAGTDEGVGGQVSAGYLVGVGGTMKTYGSTGVVDGAVGASAGVGFEAGVVGDVRDFYGDGYQVGVSAGPVSINVSFNRDNEWTGASVAVAESTGAGIFHFDTHTEDTTGR